MATKGADIFDVPDAGQSGEFSLCRAGGGLYFAVIANGGDGGRLFVGLVGGPPARIDLGPLGVTGALSVRLDGHGPGGTLVAYIKRIIDTDGQDRGRRVITPVETGIAVGGGDTPATPPAPPSPAPTPIPADVGQLVANLGGAINALAGPADGKGAAFNSVAGVHNGVDATYNKVVDETSAVLGVLDPLSQLAREAARAPGWLWQPPTRDYGLPHELEPFVGTDFQQYVCATLIALLEFVTRLSEFPKADGTSILRT